MTTGLLTTAGLVGLFMAVTTLALISYGTHHYGNVAIGTSMGVTAFSLLLVAAAFQARSVTATTLTTDDVRQPAPELDRRSARSSSPCSSPRWTCSAPCSAPSSCRSPSGRWHCVPAVALFFLWELGKLIARRSADDAPGVVPVAPVEAALRTRPISSSCGRLAEGQSLCWARSWVALGSVRTQTSPMTSTSCRSSLRSGGTKSASSSLRRSHRFHPR